MGMLLLLSLSSIEIYTIHLLRHEREVPTPRSFNQLRPRADKLCTNEDLKVGNTVLLNYNIEDSKERGLW